MEGSQRYGNLVFAVNGNKIELPCADPSITLLDFLRNQSCFKSPKLGCGEGGCGACVVLVSKYDPKLNKVEDFSVPSCLTLICSLNGCSITTSDGLGNTKDGYHPIHQRFAGFHASQCGFCTPGMCMSLFSALVNADKDKTQSSRQGFSNLTSFEAEKSIQGNLCRCTGYRPIADVCKSFASDVDIEDLGLNIFWKNEDSKETKESKLPPYDPSKDLVAYPEFLKNESVTLLDSTKYPWFSPVSIEELQSLLRYSVAQNIGSVKIVVGNTGTGYYKETQRYDQYIDLRHMPELSILQKDRKGIEIGATVPLAKLISFLNEGTKENLGSYGKMVSQKVALHLEKVANPFVRHTASVGGNLAMAQKYGFPSDPSTLILALGGIVSILTVSGQKKLTWEEVLARPALDSRTVLLSVWIPFKRGGNFLQKFSKFLFETYRVAPRPLGSALSYLNAAFMADVSPHRNGIVIHSIKLAFGAFGTKHAIRAKRVEKYLTGKILNIKLLYEALKLIKRDVVPEPGTSHPEYRSSLAVGVLFKFLYPLTDVDSAVSSGLFEGVGETFVEGGSKSNTDDGDNTSQGETQTILSSSKQVVESSTKYYPVGEPLKKYGAEMQASGEAVYVDDIPSPPNCLHGAFIYSTKPLARVKSISLQLGSNSLADGVIAILTVKDIPSGGENIGVLSQFGTETLFAEDLTQCAGDRIALVIAESQRSADVAAKTAHIEYDTQNTGSPILDVDQAVEKGSFLAGPVNLSLKPVGNVSKGMAEADHKILSAELRLPSEYYFYMETQTTLAVPDEDNSMVCYVSTQFSEFSQRVIARCLGVPENNIRVITRRAGGGFGGKAIRSMPVSAACALAAYKLQRPVKIYVNRNTDMVIIGGRHPLKVTYSVGFKSNGKITALHVDILMNGGISEDITPIIASHVIAALKKYNWGAFSFDVKNCKTNLISKSSMRALGDVQGSYIADAIMEHVASVLEMEGDSVSSKNIHTYKSLKLFYKDSAGESGEYTLPSIMDQLTTSSRFVERSKMIDQFNQKNTWKKRGISRLPIVHQVMQHATPATVCIMWDGSIVVHVGGAEIGQGLWTKVKQVVAYALSLIERSWSEELVEKVRLIQIDTLNLVQTGYTAESTKSESSCEAARLCCNILVERLSPLKKKLLQQNGSVDWTSLIQQAEAEQLHLQTTCYFVPGSSSGQYLNFGAAVSEVEVDVLTGQPIILQSDIIYDCGQSLNPAVDLGQIEGAFVQGIGYFMLEEYLTNEDGLMVTNSTWTYHIPTIDTIPESFNVRVLNSGHHKKRILSSKASGEPPLLLAATVHCATRAAIREARKQLKTWDKLDESVSEFYLDVPAILPVVKTQCNLDYVEKHLESLISKTST